MSQSIVVDYELAHPPEKVWRALTEPALLARWLMQNDIAPRVGHKFTMRAQPQGSWDGIVHCEVLTCDPPRVLSYSWKGGTDENKNYGSHLDTVVTWTLEPRGQGTHLRLTHSGFLDKDRFAFDAMGKGWRQMGERFQGVIAEV